MVSVASYRNLLGRLWSRIFCRPLQSLYKSLVLFLVTDFLYGRLLLIEIFHHVCAHEFSIERFAPNRNLCSRLWSRIFCRAKIVLQKFRAHVCTKRFSVATFAPNTNLLSRLCLKIFCSAKFDLQKIHDNFLLTDFLYAPFLLIEIFCAVCAQRFSVRPFAPNTNFSSRSWLKIFCSGRCSLYKSVTIHGQGVFV